MPKPDNFAPPTNLPRELVIPPAIQEKPASREFVRAWFDGEGLDISVQAKLSQEPQVWGVLLADIVTHTCKAYALEYPDKVPESLATIIHVLLSELQAND
jgi:hypothetical protein